MFFSLSADSVATVTTVGQIAPKLVQVTLNAAGSIPANTTIIGNNEISPAGSTYTVALNLAGGGKIWGPQGFTINSPTTNLNTYTP